jgi:hypothetical protein
VILDDVCHLINYILVGVLLNLLLENLILLDNIKQFVCQVILRALVILLDHGGSYLRRRDRENCTDHPVRAAPEAAVAHEINILVGNTTEKVEYILNLKGL